eukprot:TRINITY_DN24556_c3_g1_i2.p1 TRINITY_DN24556_c3_g1~~TRINITY_DN24556_c3_g1_i2.p1  ORF type:complete len:209 (+),score=29.61 TRINITY_DN24556_c3_g1_i2:51-677(+)
MDPFNGIRANKLMAAYCFHVLEAKLKQWKAGMPGEDELPRGADANGMFVTYEKTDGDLRGCIGTFAKGNLKDTLERYSLIAGLRDSRFHPIDSEELPDLRCSVTVLSEMQPIPKWDAWTPGKHGVYISLNKDRRNYSATFLPSVIIDQGWSKHQTFEHLLAKSGYRGAPTRDIFELCEVHTYEGSKEKITYGDYRAEFRERWGFSPLE